MKRHPVDLVSLVSGAVAVLLAVLWFSLGPEEFLDQLSWAVPAGVLALGAALLAGAVRRSSERPDHPADTVADGAGSPRAVDAAGRAPHRPGSP